MSSFIPAVVSAVLLLQFGRGEETDTYWFFNCTSTLAFPLYDCAGQTFEISEDTIPDGMDKVKIDCRKATGSGCEGAKFIINDVPVSDTIDCFGYPSACKNTELLLVDVDVDDFESNRYLRCGKNGDYSCEGMDLTLVSSHLLVDCPYPHTCRNMVATLYDNSTITFMAQESKLQNNPAPKIYLYDGSECFLGSGNGVDWADLAIYTVTSAPTNEPTAVSTLPTTTKPLSTVAPATTSNTPTTTSLAPTTTTKTPPTTTTPTTTIMIPTTTAVIPTTAKPTSTEPLTSTSKTPTTTTMIPTTTTIPTTMPTSTESLTSTEMQTSTGTTEKPATERPSASSEMLTSTETRTSTGMPTTSSLPMPTTTSTTLLPTTSTRTLPTAVESTSGKPQSTRRSTELTTTFSTKKTTATVLQTMTPTANRTTTNILPTVSSKRNTTVVIMATNTTESGIEESDDSSTGRRQVLSARMWLFFGGVFCLSTVGCTFIWTKYKRNQRIATELMLRKLAIRSESERILRHKAIVKRDVSNRLSRVSAAVASLPSSEIPAVAPFNDEVVASSTEMAVLSSNFDTPLPIPRSAEERSLSNDLELCRPMATAGVSEAAAETGAVGPFVWVKAGEMSAELTTTTTLSSQFYDELEGAVAGDGLGTVIYARAVARTEDDEVKGDSEALSAAASISSNCAALSVLCPTESQMSEGPSSGLAALRLADIEDAQVDGDAKRKRKPDGSFNSDGGKVEIVCVPRSGLRRQRESNRGAALPGSGVSALVPPSLSPLMWSSERHSGGFAVLRHAIEDALADGGEVAVCRSRSGEVLRQPPSIAVPPLLPPIVAAMHSEARSGDCSRRQEECGKKESRKKRKAKGRRKKKRKKAAVDLSLLEASAEQRAKWTHSQWYHYYRAYDCSTPEAYRRSMASMSADVSPRTVASCELPRHFE